MASRSARVQCPPADGLVGDRRVAHTVGPGPAPPRTLVRRREAPHRGGGVHAPEPGGAGPRQQVAPGVRFSAVRPCHRPVGRQPLVETDVERRPRERGVVGVPGGYDATRPAHPPHLAERGDGVGEMLQHLVGVHHVEAVVLIGERVHVARLEAHAVHTVRLPARHVDHVVAPVDPDDGARSHPPGQIDRDRARTASDVEHVEPRREVRHKVRGRVLNRAPRVRPQDGSVVTVRVGVVGNHIPSLDEARSPGDRRPYRARSWLLIVVLSNTCSVT
jgi:hypothetical protein